jgi:hypothetical protein
LLESDVMPGDPMANIKLESLLISNAQRECHSCTDNVPCESCAHPPKSMKPEDILKEIHETYPDWHKTKVITEALQQCEISNPESTVAWYEYIEPQYEKLTSSL